MSKQELKKPARKKFFLVAPMVISILFLFFVSFSQNNVTITKTDTSKTGKIYSFDEIDIKPMFPGGGQALNKFIMNNIKYPEEEFKNGKSGIVIVSFIITSEGSVKNPSITRSAGKAFDDEALRVIRAMPKWKPGKTEGKAVTTQAYMPIKYVLKK